MVFNNIDIDRESLPKVGSDSYNSLEEKYRTVLIIKSIIFSVVLLMGYTGYYFIQFDNYPLYISILILVLIIFLIFSNTLIAIFGFSRKKYKIRSHDLIYKTGLFWRSETSVPFVRVQHSEVIQGPIERLFGLSKLKLYTAGGHSSDLSIPGLNPQKAEQLKDFIVKRIQEEEE